MLLAEMALWFQKAFIAEAEKVSSGPLSVNFFVHVSTLANVAPDTKHSSEKDDDIKSTTSSSGVLPSILPGRPDVPSHIQHATTRAGSLAVVVCGPEELSFDTRNAVAAEQTKIAGRKVACSECYLHTEAFGL